MLNGSWIAEAPPPGPGSQMSDEFLPPGLKFQLRVLGPTRRAIEEQRANELGGLLRLTPPLSPGLCTTGLAHWVCQNGEVREPTKPVTLDVVLEFWRLEDDAFNDPANLGFVEQGARPGAQFVSVTLSPDETGQGGIQWQWWMKNPDTLVGGYLETPARGDAEMKPQLLRRQPR